MALQDRDGQVKVRLADGSEKSLHYRRATSLVSRGLAEFAKPKRARRAPKPDLPETSVTDGLAIAEDMPPVTGG